MRRKKRNRPQREVKIYTLYLTDTESGLVQEWAEEAGMSISKYIRHLLLEGPVTVHRSVSVEDPRLTALLQLLQETECMYGQIVEYLCAGGSNADRMETEIRYCLDRLADVNVSLSNLVEEYRRDSNVKLRNVYAPDDDRAQSGIGIMQTA